MCRSLPQMLVATILRMTPCGAAEPSGISSLGKSSSSTRTSLMPWNATARFLVVMKLFPSVSSEAWVRREPERPRGDTPVLRCSATPGAGRSQRKDRPPPHRLA